MVPLRARRMRPAAAADDERSWLRATSDRISGADSVLGADGALALASR